MWQRSILFALCALTATTTLAAIPAGRVALQITHLQDYQFDKIDPNYDSSVEHTLCVQNTGNSSYQVSISSASNQKQFAMLSSNGNSQLPYHVFWSDSVATPKYVELKPNMPVPMQNASSIANCGDKDNASLEIKLLTKEMQGVTAGQYNTNLEITVAPV